MPDEEDPKSGDASDSFEGEEKSRDLPGLSSIFSTTQSGLKRIRKARSSVDPDVVPDEDEDTPDLPDAGPKKSTTTDTPPPAAPSEPGVEDGITEVRDGPEPGPVGAAEADDGPPAADIEISGGLSMVDTAEIPVRRPEPAPQSLPPAPPAPAPSSPAVTVREDRSPAARSQPLGRRTDAELPVVVDTTYPDTPKSRGAPSWLLYLGVVAVVVAMVAALVLTALSLK